MRLARTALMTIAVAGCARAGSGGTAQEACTPETEVALAGATGRSLEGDYVLTLVATSGDSAGRQAVGGLTLRPTTRPDAALAGTTDLAARRLGARLPGEVGAAADSAPGVLVLDVDGQPAGIMLRLGSRANERGVVRFEGEYTALTVHRIRADGFSGSWRSGDLTERAAGHFCARRIGS
jgi:hypothetical protein